MKPPYDLRTSQLFTREPNFFDACYLISNTQNLVTAIQLKQLRANPAKVRGALRRDKWVEYKCLGMWQVMISTRSNTSFSVKCDGYETRHVCVEVQCNPTHGCVNVAASGGACISVCTQSKRKTVTSLIRPHSHNSKIELLLCSFSQEINWSYLNVGFSAEPTAWDKACSLVTSAVSAFFFLVRGQLRCHTDSEVNTAEHDQLKECDIMVHKIRKTNSLLSHLQWLIKGYSSDLG